MTSETNTPTAELLKELRKRFGSQKTSYESTANQLLEVFERLEQAEATLKVAAEEASAEQFPASEGVVARIYYGGQIQNQVPIDHATLEQCPNGTILLAWKGDQLTAQDFFRVVATASKLQ